MIRPDQAQELQARLAGVNLHDISLKNQPSVLIAAAITGLESAIPIQAVAEGLKRLGFDVKPTVAQTRGLIQQSRLFQLMGLIAFTQDQIAQDTVTWLQTNLPHQPIGP